MQPDKKCKFCKRLIDPNIHTYSYDQAKQEYICEFCLKAFNEGYKEGKKCMKSEMLNTLHWS